MIGRTVSHYRILSPLGSGGMGVVYLAEDERLGRQVALKFLPATWSQERTALERFRVEARAASSLSHPGICAIFDIGEDGDMPFIVMEALKGETLRERILKGPLKVTEVLDIGAQLADALEAAHAQGIVHRDIKPANIFIGEKNRVKVLDFGLAKLTSSSSTNTPGGDTTSPATMRATENQITVPGTALGTVSYMSPEQARGEEIDSRTDLFSLGAVLYEMVTGRQAFGGSTTAVVYDAILNRAPRPVAHLNPLVPLRLETVIATALEKERELRYQHASDLQAELRRIRRDIDSASFAGSQPGMAPPQSGQSLPAMTVALPSGSAQAAPPPPPPATRSWERGALAIALLAVVGAGFWIWRGQSPAVTQTATAPQTPPVIPAAPTPSAPVTEAPAVTVPAPAVAPPARETPAPVPQAPVARAPQATQPSPPGRDERRAAPAPATPPPGPPATPTVTLAAPPPQNVPAPAPVNEPAPSAAPQVPAPQIPAPQVPATAPPVPAPAPPPPRPAPVEPAPAPAAAPVENDDAAIRSVIRSYEQAIETKDIRLFRTVRPGLTAAAEAVLQNSFKQVDSQQVDIKIDSLTINGRNATARISRRDTLTTRGQKRTENSSQTLRFEKTAAGWVIAE